MKLVAGLGNPGNGYKLTRHNMGFLVIDHLVNRKGLIFKKKKLYDFVADSENILMKPRTYMNRSGLAVTSIKTSYSFDDILVVYDDVSLPFGEIRFRHKGSAGGHNGLKSIQSDLGTTEFKRFRIGIGAPDIDTDLSDYVLSKFSTEEVEFLSEIISYSAELLDIYLLKGFEDLLDYHSKNKKTYSEKLEAFQDHKSKGGI